MSTSALHGSVGQLPFTRPVNDLDLSNDGRFLAIAFQPSESPDALIGVYDLSDGSEVAAFGADGYAGRGVAFQGSGLFFLLEGTDHRTELLRVSALDEAPEHVAWYGLDDRVRTLSRNVDGSRMAVNGHAVEVWDHERREVIRRLANTAKDGSPACSSFRADGEQLALYGLHGRDVVTWDVQRNIEVARWPGPDESASQILWSQDGSMVFAVGAGSGAYLYSIPEGERLLEPLYDEHALTMKMAFLPGESVIVGPGQAIDVGSMQMTELPDFPTGYLSAASQAWESRTVAFSTVRGDVFWYHF